MSHLLPEECSICWLLSVESLVDKNVDVGSELELCLLVIVVFCGSKLNKESVQPSI